MISVKKLRNAGRVSTLAALTLAMLTPALAVDLPQPAPAPTAPKPFSDVPAHIQPQFPTREAPQLGDTVVEEDIKLKLPNREELMPVGANLPVIRLEASYNQPVNLKDVVRFAALYNLQIGVSREDMRSQKWLLVGALGRYAPDALMSYRTQFLAGSTLVQGIIPASFATPNANANAGYRFYGFRGGQVLFGALQSKHNFLASKAALRGTINDVLRDVADQYYELVRQQAFLEIRVRAVETSRAQLVLNKQLENAGTGTYFNVLQADTQLASDELNLLRQEVLFRTAAIRLAKTLNMDMSANLMTVDTKVTKVRLLDPTLDINALMRISIKYRPELKQFEELRLAARRNIQVQASPLYPQMQFFGSYTGNGATLGPGYRVQPGSFSTVPLTSLPPLGSTGSSSSSLGPGAAAGAATGLGPSPVYENGSVFNPPSIVKRQMRKSYNIGIQVDWNYFNCGIPDVANVQSARHIARKALLQANQAFLDVLEQVRSSYLNSLIAEREVDVTSRAVASSSEQLRLARVRLANGVGTNIDVLQAQQVWTNSLIAKADAILKFNFAQVRLLHAIGIISVDTLTSGRLAKE
jgi:outer membrane protein TolC